MLTSIENYNIKLNYKTTIVIFSVIAVLGAVSCFLPPIVNLGIIAAIIVVLAIFVRPVESPIFFALFVVILYGNLFKYLTGSRHTLLLVDLITLLLFLKIVFFYCIRKNFPIYNPLVEFSLIAFLGISLLQILNLNVPGIEAGLEGFRKTSFYMIGFFIGLDYVRDKMQLKKMVSIFTWLCLPIIAYGIKQAFIMSAFDLKMVGLNWASVWTYRIYGWNRPIGIFSGPFHYAMLCIIIVLCLIYLYLESKKIGYILLIPLPLLGSLLAMTRTNIIALVGSMLIFFFLYFIYQRGISRRKIFSYGLLLFLVTALVVGITAGHLQPVSRAIGSLSRLSENTRFLNRVKVWEEMLENIPRHPITAYGMGSAGDTLEHIYDFPIHFTSHNLILKIVFETGLPGLFFYCLFFGGWLAVAYRGLHFKNIEFKNLSILIISIVSVILFNGLVGSAVEAFPINFIVWFAMGTYVKIYSIETVRRSGAVLPSGMTTS